MIIISLLPLYFNPPLLIRSESGHDFVVDAVARLIGVSVHQLRDDFSVYHTPQRAVVDAVVALPFHVEKAYLYGVVHHYVHYRVGADGVGGVVEEVPEPVGAVPDAAGRLLPLQRENLVYPLPEGAAHKLVADEVVVTHGLSGYR